MKKLKLNKKVVASLSKNDSMEVKGGYINSDRYQCVILNTYEKHCLTIRTCVVSRDVCVSESIGCPTLPESQQYTCAVAELD